MLPPEAEADKKPAPIPHLKAVNNNQSDDEHGNVLVFDAAGNPVIRHYQGRLPEILNAVGTVLRDADKLNIFVHAGRLVRVIEQTGTSFGIYRPPGALVIHPIDGTHLMELVGLACRHEKWDSRTKFWVPTDCPRRVAEAYLARGHWPDLQQLSGFIEAPTISNDLLIDSVGFDPVSGLYLTLAYDLAGMKTIPKKPRLADAKKALAELVELVSPKDSAGFPFVSDADQSAFIAAIITALLRRGMASAPMFSITAPAAGTGKTLLADTPAIIATGRRSSVLSLGHDDAEMEKRFDGALMSGDACLMIDNIERPLKSDYLCQLLTQPYVSRRPLGSSVMLKLPTNALILATGNNLSIVGDLRRRVVLIRLDANTERPEHRTFNRNHIAEAFKKRGALISAALMIPMAYIAAGEPMPPDHKPAGSFEEWDRLVRRPLIWAGFPDPFAVAEVLRETDSDLETARAFFMAWSETLTLQGARTVSEVVNAGTGADNPELYDALQLVCSEKINSRRVGYWLRAHRDRIVDGMQLRRIGQEGHAKVATWEVVKCG